MDPSSVRFRFARFALSALGLAGVAVCVAVASSESVGRIIDLTHAFDSETIFWPTEEVGISPKLRVPGLSIGNKPQVVG